MRTVRYHVAMSLDGYIAGPKGEFDWIVQDPDIDFAALFARFDTFLMGRRTFEIMPRNKKKKKKGDPTTYVFSRTLRQEDYPEVTIVADQIAETVSELRRQDGKDIWLFGGGELFRSLLAAGLVDAVEVAIIPVLLGGGIPMLPVPSPMATLKLTEQKVYKTSGIVILSYAVVNSSRSAASSRKKTTRRS
jgi:dihydrofolate reductase